MRKLLLISTGVLLLCGAAVIVFRFITIKPLFADMPLTLPLNDMPVIVISHHYQDQNLLNADRQKCDFLTWDRGQNRLIRFAQLEDCGDYRNLVWMAGGTRFLYADGSTGNLDVQLFDGEQFQTISPLVTNGEFLVAPDEDHFAALTCRSTTSALTYVYTIFSAESGEPSCSFIGIGVAEFSSCAATKQRECHVSLDDGTEWRVGAKNLVCNSVGRCTMRDQSVRQPTPFQSSRFDVMVEMEMCDYNTNCVPYNGVMTQKIFNSWVRIRDRATQDVYQYNLPGYRIQAISWSPLTENPSE